MTKEQSIKIIRELLVAVDNGGVLYSDKEKKKLKEALNAAIESLGAEYVITDDGKIYPLPKNPFPNATSVTIPPIGKWIKRIYNEDRLGYECDQCGELSYNATNFCPMCGADMREGDVE